MANNNPAPFQTSQPTGFGGQAPSKFFPWVLAVLVTFMLIIIADINPNDKYSVFKTINPNTPSVFNTGQMQQHQRKLNATLNLSDQ